MKFSIKLNGGDFLEFDLKDPAKATELVNTLMAASIEGVSVKSDSDVFGEPQHGTIERVLNDLRGTKTSKFIKLLAELDGYGATDVVIKQKMGGSDINLAPFISSISKACSRLGVDKKAILIRNEKRIRANKLLYHYQLTKEAADFVNSIDDFEKDEYFFEDPEDQELAEFNREWDEFISDAPFTTGTNRDRVRAAADNRTIREISEVTGLSMSQVRGVVGAIGEKDKYRKEPTDAGLKYTYLGKTVNA